MYSSSRMTSRIASAQLGSVVDVGTREPLICCKTWNTIELNGYLYHYTLQWIVHNTWRLSHPSQVKLVNCNPILGQVSDQIYIAISSGSRIFTGGAPTLGAGDAGIKFNFSSENCMKLRKNWPLGGGARRGRPPPPSDPPLAMPESIWLNLLSIGSRLHVKSWTHVFCQKVKQWSLNSFPFEIFAPLMNTKQRKSKAVFTIQIFRTMKTSWMFDITYRNPHGTTYRHNYISSFKGPFALGDKFYGVRNWLHWWQS